MYINSILFVLVDYSDFAVSRLFLQAFLRMVASTLSKIIKSKINRKKFRTLLRHGNKTQNTVEK